MIAELLPLIADMENKEKEDSVYYPRPSLAGPQRCTRQLVYWGLGFTKKPFPGRFVLLLDDSSWQETLVADWIRKTSFTLHSEQMNVACPPPIKDGHIDGIITDLLGIDRLWEMKAINHFTFTKYQDHEDMPTDYFVQCCLYLWGLNKINPEINEAVLLIKNKNTSNFLDYLLIYNKDKDILTAKKKTDSNGKITEINKEFNNIMKETTEKFERINQYISANKLPRREYDIDDWHCSYCQFGKICYEGYEKEFAEMKTAGELPNEIADTVRYYKELGAQKSEIEKQYKELSGKVKSIMKELNIRQGRAGEYLCKLSLSKVERLDKSLLTEAEKLRATTITMQERLTISSSARKEVQDNGENQRI